MPWENMALVFTCLNKDSSFQSMNTDDFIGHNCTTAGENTYQLSTCIYLFTDSVFGNVKFRFGSSMSTICTGICRSLTKLKLIILLFTVLLVY